MATRPELLARIVDHEDNFTERKSQGVSNAELRQTMVAFANSVPEEREAVLYVGIDPHGRATGCADPDAFQRKVRRLCQQDCYPPIRFQSEALDYQGVQVVAFVVPSSSNRPHFAGPAYVRVGAESVAATPEIYEDLISSRHVLANRLLRQKGELVTITVLEKRLGDRRPQRLANHREVHEGRIIGCTPHLLTLRSNALNAEVSEPMINIAVAWDIAMNRLEIIVQNPNANR